MFENFSYNQLEARLKECKTHLPIFQSWLDFTLDLYRNGIADENNVKTSISLVSHCERSIAVIETRMNPYHDELGRFTTSDNATTVSLGCIQIGKSVGAKAHNYEVVDFETGKIYHIVEGTSLKNVKVFAGKGTKTKFRDAHIYVRKYGGKEEDWQHAKAIAELVNNEGDGGTADIHWFQCQGVGKKDFKVKVWF